MMARLAYSALLWVALPFVLARLAWRARRQPGYLQHLGERFGAAPSPGGASVIWVHAVSVGETRAAAPLIEMLRRDHPGASILLTHMTPTGRATGREIFGDRVTQAWLPWDLGFAVRRFLARTKPDFGVLLETEIWPNLLAACHERGIPVFLVNARLSERSAVGYARIAGLAREALGNLSGIAAQTAVDATRLEALGARNVAVTGNIKFDLAVPDDDVQRGRELRALFGTGRRVWVLGSTRDGEEELLVQAIEAAQPDADILVIIVPRHPQRFDEVASLLAARGGPVARRSQGVPVPAGARYLLGDSMGEMLAYYAAADVVFVGGSLKSYGGQNLIEPCAVGRPVIFGPHTFNFESAAQAALAEGAGLRARDAPEAVAMALALLDDGSRRAEMGGRALRFAQSNRGALERLSAWLSPRVAPSRAPARG
ncbi:MAG: lipid IV(A) 3-deoxy-D-manno-octulosonic acid transferase [Betaproteobacteria bacterium]|nr:lipid IV(A) 3-deoxy-D-manno-octulosonic acid transferase [Betaproteobacteria bacterium]